MKTKLTIFGLMLFALAIQIRGATTHCCHRLISVSVRNQLVKVACYFIGHIQNQRPSAKQQPDMK